MSSLITRLSNALPWRRKDTPLPPDPYFQKMLDQSGDLIEMLRQTNNTQKSSVENAARLIDRNDRFEATLAGISGHTAGLEEAVKTLTVATEVLINKTAVQESATAAETSRQTMTQQINAHTDDVLSPIQDAMQAIPTKLDTLNTSLTILPDKITESFQVRLLGELDTLQVTMNALRAENAALKQQLAQYQSLPPLVAMQDEHITVLTGENARLSALVTSPPVTSGIASSGGAGSGL